MTRILPCLACGEQGREGRDVMFKLIEIPEDERRTVSVVLPDFNASDSLQMPVNVPEQYVTEPRCRDEVACYRRVLAYALSEGLPATSEALPVPVTTGGGPSAASLVAGAPPAPAPEEPEFPTDLPAELEEYVL